MVEIYEIYHIILFIIFRILYKTMLINPKKRSEKNKRIYSFYRQYIYIYLL